MLNDPFFLIVALLAVSLGATLQGLAGFGMAIIAAPVLVLIDANFLPAPIMLLGFTLSLLNTLRYRQRLQVGHILPAIVGRIPGSVLGIVLLALLPRAVFSLGFSLFIIFSVVLTYRHFKLSQSPRNLLIAGFFSGLMGTTTSIGGPPIALVYQNNDPATVRAELGLFFLAGTIMSLALLWASGNFSYGQLQLTLPLLPAVLAGFGLSLWLDKRFKAHYLKPIIATLSLTTSTVILVQAIRAF